MKFKDARDVLKKRFNFFFRFIRHVDMMKNRPIYFLRASRLPNSWHNHIYEIPFPISPRSDPTEKSNHFSSGECAEK